MASITRRKDSWQAEVRIKGYPAKRKNFSFKDKNVTEAAAKREAKIWVAEVETKLRNNSFISSKHTVKEAIERYIASVLPEKRNAKNELQKYDYWIKTLGDYSIATVSPELIGEQRDKLLKNKAPSTVNRYLAALSAMYTIAVKEWRWSPSNPVSNARKCREPAGRVRYLSDDERERLLSSIYYLGNAQEHKHDRMTAYDYLYYIVIVAISSGMRKNEIMTLKWSQVNLEAGEIILLETKNGKKRNVPVSGHTLRLLRELKHSSTSEWLFPGRDGTKPINIDIPFRRALKAAQIDDFMFHDLRHTAASEMLKSGADIAVIAALLGHSSIQMTMRYAHLMPSKAKEYANLTTDRLWGKS